MKTLVTLESAIRHHDISVGHRVTNHESKCAHLHGHNYRIHFEITASKLDSVGRVLDFSVMKSILCEWLESNWDHKFLIWQKDPQASKLHELDPVGVVMVDFNPTAENMAHFLMGKGQQLLDTNHPGVKLVSIIIEETRKCSVKCEI